MQYNEILEILKKPMTVIGYYKILQTITHLSLEQRQYIYGKYKMNSFALMTNDNIIHDDNLNICHFRYLIFLDSINKLSDYNIEADITKSIYYCYLIWKGETLDVSNDLLIKISKVFSFILDTTYDVNGYVDINYKYKQFNTTFYNSSKNNNLTKQEVYAILINFKNINFYKCDMWKHFKLNLALYDYINLMGNIKFKNIDDYIELMKNNIYDGSDILNFLFFEKRIKYHHYFYKKLDENKLFVNIDKIFKGFYKTNFHSINDKLLNEILYVFIKNGMCIYYFEENLYPMEKLYAVFDYDKLIIDMKKIEINVDRITKLKNIL